jgi:hypothetical protein
LTGGIDINDDVAESLAVPDAANGIGRPSFGKTEPLKERAKGFQAGLIHISQETAQTGAMGQVSTPKQGHECSTKGS